MKKYYMLDEFEEFMYLTTLDKYELRYMNEPLKRLLNIQDESYLGKRCYELILGRSTPCDYCHKDMLSKGKFILKKAFVPEFGKYYQLKYKISHIEDEDLRFMRIQDITNEENNNNKVKRIHISENIIYNFIDEITSGVKIDKAIDELLHDLCEYYKADRSYVFAIDYENNTLSNTHEYTALGVEPQINNLQRLDLSIIDRWQEIFKRDGEIFIDSVNNEIDKESDEYKILKDQGIERLVAFPFYMDGRLIGFLGVDDPKNDYQDTTILKSISFFVFYDLTKQYNIQKLQMLSHYDTLTGLRNRNSYVETIDRLERIKPNTLGVIYIDLNGLKETNDKYGHKFGDDLLINAGRVIAKHFHDNAYRIGGDEFVIILLNLNFNDFKNRVHDLQKTLRGNKAINVSLGYVYDDNPKNIEAIITEADHNMYLEKCKYYEKKTKGKK